MARILASGADAVGMGPSWLFGLCVFVVSVWAVSFAVFLCGRSHDDDDRPKKKPAPAPSKKTAPAPAAKASRGAARSGTVVDTSGMYVASYISSDAYGGCSGGYGGHHHYGSGCAAAAGGQHGGGVCGGGGGGGC